jgi:hypothetical protein
MPTPLVPPENISPLPLGERVRVRGKNGISRDDLSPPPVPSPLKGEGFLFCFSKFSLYN